MTFDVIAVTEEEVAAMDSIQQKMIRTAQQKKNELAHKLEADLYELKNLLFANGVSVSGIYDDAAAKLNEEFNYQVAIIKEQLEFNLSLKEPTTPDDTGGGGTSGGDEAGYVVDYELSYLDRYIAVRDYYMSIEDPNERVALLAADEVARKYLGSYYNTLFDYLVTFT